MILSGTRSIHCDGTLGCNGRKRRGGKEGRGNNPAVRRDELGTKFSETRSIHSMGLVGESNGKLSKKQ